MRRGVVVTGLPLALNYGNSNGAVSSKSLLTPRDGAPERPAVAEPGTVP